MSRAPCLILAGAAVAGSVVSLVAPLPTFLVWNASASAPRGLYRIADAGALDVPDLVVVAPPETIASFLHEGGYLAYGTPILKRVAALSGQTVCRLDRSVSVDGVALGAALPSDRLGRPLPVWQGCWRVGPGEIFLMNFDVRDSLDGRYFGPIPRDAVVGRAVPLYTDEDGDGRFAWQ